MIPKANIIYQAMSGAERVQLARKVPGGMASGVSGVRAITKYIADHPDEFKHVEQSEKFKEMLKGHEDADRMLEEDSKRLGMDNNKIASELVQIAKLLVADKMEPETPKDWKLEKEKDSADDAVKLTKALNHCKSEIDKAVRTSVKNIFLPALKGNMTATSIEDTRDVGLKAISEYMKWVSEDFLHSFMK